MLSDNWRIDLNSNLSDLLLMKMTSNESPASGSLNTNTIAQQANTALNTVGDKVSDLTGQHETVNKGTCS